VGPAGSNDPDEAANWGLGELAIYMRLSSSSAEVFHRRDTMGLILLLVVLVLLFGGGGFYMGAPYHYYGGGLGTILIIVIVVLLLRGWLSTKSGAVRIRTPRP
jgi:hypothetical protein